jgi:hypothetical protein
VGKRAEAKLDFDYEDEEEDEEDKVAGGERGIRTPRNVVNFLEIRNLTHK